MAGMPVPKGGGACLADLLVRLIRDQGGYCHSDIHVQEGAGEVRQRVKCVLRTPIQTRRAVLCLVTPNSCIWKLLELKVVPAWLVESSRHFRYGRGDMQIHMALS